MREGVDLHVRETAVELVIETRGQEHADAVVAALDGAGYDTRVVHVAAGVRAALRAAGIRARSVRETHQGRRAP